MRMLFVAVSAIFVASAFPQTAVHSQQGPSIQLQLPGGGQQQQEQRRDERHCEELDHQERETRERLDRNPSGEERERLDHQLHDIRHEKEDQGCH
jgi:hypothetical protein